MQINDPVLVEYMLQYLYGLEYIEEPRENDDSITWNKKKKSSKLQSKRREQLEPQPWPYDPFGPYKEGPMASGIKSDYPKVVPSRAMLQYTHRYMQSQTSTVSLICKRSRSVNSELPSEKSTTRRTLSQSSKLSINQVSEVMQFFVIL